MISPKDLRRELFVFAQMLIRKYNITTSTMIKVEEDGAKVTVTVPGESLDRDN